MRKYGKIDANQLIIVDQLRQVPGISVRSSASLGDGFPDLIVGFKARTYLFEVKDGEKFESQKKLTDDEQKFFDTWTGHCAKVESFDEILNIINPPANGIPIQHQTTVRRK